jgi:hypothetical protein
MPMNDKKWIVLGLIIFLGLFTFPLWYNMVIKAGKAAPAPKLVLTAKAKAAGSCVMSKEYMAAEHMHLLDKWRLTVVRDGEREFVNPEGKVFGVSLSNVCLDCHSNKAEFCDRCHNYASFDPIAGIATSKTPKEKNDEEQPQKLYQSGGHHRFGAGSPTTDPRDSRKRITWSWQTNGISQGPRSPAGQAMGHGNRYPKAPKGRRPGAAD